MNESLRAELLALAAHDAAVRAELAASGALFDGDHPRMGAVHRDNAARLHAIIEAHGWPVPAVVGEDGAEAAWRIAQHAIGAPAFQRRARALLEDAAARKATPLWQVALLDDRIRTLEGRPQRYATQFDWDDDGAMSPIQPIEDPARLDARRRAMGLPSHAEDLRRHRASAGRSGEPRPVDLAARRRAMEAWARRVGWRPSPAT